MSDQINTVVPIRQNMIYLIIGRIGSGKTDDVKNVAQQIYLNNPSINKMIVFDEFDTDAWQDMRTWNHPEWNEYKMPIISESQMLRLSKGQARLIQTVEDIPHYFNLFRQLRNSIVIIEDATRMTDPQEKIPNALKSLIFDVKQKNIELFLVYHSLMDVPKKIAQHARIIILHHTSDSECPKKFSNPNIKIAFEKLKAMDSNKNPYSRLVIPVNVATPTK